VYRLSILLKRRLLLTNIRCPQCKKNSILQVEISPCNEFFEKLNDTQLFLTSPEELVGKGLNFTFRMGSSENFPSKFKVNEGYSLLICVEDFCKIIFNLYRKSTANTDSMWNLRFRQGDLTLRAHTSWVHFSNTNGNSH